ncbi:hypothetical protein HAX54_041259 [Datura stramonium]|uniref:XS domain-containing protein n=1 Tax=Datura stramonium TaxID=4076 RepID=A0ABS8VQY3_DATST|nr:hypothetical protein [Datura stramonium]
MYDDLLERADALYREHGPHLERDRRRSRERFISRDLPGPSNLSLREKHGTTSNRGAGIMISSDVRSARKTHDRGDADEMWISRDTYSVDMSRKPNVPGSKYLKNGRPHKAAAANSSSRNLSVMTPKKVLLLLAKTEPPENSKDFKQLVQNAFFRFVRHLNETPAKRRKYSEQAGSLKCLVCGRDSEEFADSESLVRHALTSSKAGLRSQHLGFHKALCALIGWKRQMLLKIVGSITSSNPDQRVVGILTEELESKLRDMGFGEKAKVSRGKPANQSILMVKFSATLSGLEEAVRLSEIYAHRKHGRGGSSCASVLAILEAELIHLHFHSFTREFEFIGSVSHLGCENPYIVKQLEKPSSTISTTMELAAEETKNKFQKLREEGHDNGSS